jgi:hypothetical protein
VGVLQKNFDTQRIPSLQSLVDEPGAAAVVGARAERSERSACNQIDEEPKITVSVSHVRILFSFLSDQMLLLDNIS